MTEQDMVLADKTLHERFWRKVDVRSDNECWPWRATLSAGRYGAIKVGGKKGRDLKAHRIQCIWRGEDVEGKVVRHTCDNSICVNPSHLLVGTQAENVEDCYLRGRNRHARGQYNGKAVLSDKQVMGIKLRLARGETTSKIAMSLGLRHLQVYNIATRKSYAHIGSEINYEPPSKKGSNNVNSHVTEEDVAEMRRMYRKIWNYNKVAECFGVSSILAMRAIKGDRWPGNINGEPPVTEREGKRRQYGQRKLTDEQVLEMKQYWKTKPRAVGEIATRYNVSRHLIAAIKAGRAYSWVEPH